MKKIGMLTFYSEYNYGAMLQAYALQTKIREFGYDAEFLRFYDEAFIKRGEEKVDFIHNINQLFDKAKTVEFSVKKYLLNRSVGERKLSLFDDFVERFMSTSRSAYYSLEDLKVSNDEYDGFVTGSDMVWSDIGQNLDAYFLTFASKGKRISYAPSLTGRENETIEQREKYINWINGIDCLSCREQYGINYIKKATGRQADLVVDPTLLLEKKQWKEKFAIEERSGTPYILCYMFRGINKNIFKNLESFIKKKGYRIIFIPMTVQETLYDLKNGLDPAYGPKEFIELFYNASYVVTNSFHGLLFSLIMNKPFSLIHRGEKNEWSKHEERMVNILSLLELENRFIYAKEFDINNINWNVDYNNINIQLSKLREDSLNYLKVALELIDGKSTIKKNHSYSRIDEPGIVEKCTGCSTCFNSCPTNAIHMKNDLEGFLIPHVDNNLCINCGKCVKNCSAINALEFKLPVETYCGVGNNDFVINSASGGIFVTFAKYVIEKLNGIVYGAELEMPNGDCRHIEVSRVEDLYRVQNSKYVQSDISNVLSLCKERLVMGKMVLFSGTPCQIAALKCYLGEEYENLLTVDIICHGVPSPQFLKDYIKHELPKNSSELKFRHRFDADSRRSAYDINFKSNGKIVIRSGGSDVYYSAFINGESFRECCYNCKYARQERISDITIGDCDSWKLYKGLEKNNIISSILINTEKGISFWKQCDSYFTYTELNYEEECIVNHQLRRPVIRPDRRDRLYKDLNALEWKKFSEKQKKGKSGFILKLKKIVYKLAK